jgi:hypothetical protein
VALYLIGTGPNAGSIASLSTAQAASHLEALGIYLQAGATDYFFVARVDASTTPPSLDVKRYRVTVAEA